MVKNALAADFTRVIEAGTATGAIDLAAAERPAFVILDLGLPDGAGIAVCREIRKWLDAPIIVLSARHTDAEKVALLVSVVVPEIVPHRWWEHLLHNKTALNIRTAFLFKPNGVVIAVPFLLGQARRLRDLIDHDELLDETADDTMGRGERPAALAAGAPAGSAGVQ